MRRAALKEALPGFFALIVMPLLGFLFCATIIHQFAGQYGPDRPVRTMYAVAIECNRHGPVSTRGFGFWYRCMAEIHVGFDGDFGRPSFLPVNFLSPDDIGKQVPIRDGNERRGRISYERAADQPLKRWGWLALPFGLLWLVLTGFLARNALRNVKPMPDDDSGEILIWGKRKQWVHWKLRGLVLVLAIGGAVGSTEWAFQGYRNQTAIAVVSYGLILLIVGNSLRRAIFAPHVTVTPTGLKFGKDGRLAWHEIRHVGLSKRGVLSIQPHVGEVVRIGRFGESEVGTIDAALRDRPEIGYAREGGGAIMAG